MKTIEIWSDILCPFCYIGKRRFQKALDALPQREQLEVIWRSFELDPNAKRDYELSIYELLAKKYGRSVEWAKEMNANMEEQARQLGLEFHMDRIVPTNSFDAHRLLHLSRKFGLEDAMSEKLFAAYFTHGLHIGQRENLLALAVEAGLEAAQVEAVLKSDAYADAVRQDEDEAQLLGLTGVPAFVLARKYLISGAQAPEIFVQALEKLLSEA